MKLKTRLAATALATLAAMTTTSALAETSNPLPVANAFTAQDMASLFEQETQPLQLAALSEQEMKSTEGAWGPWGAAIGAVSGLAGYTTNTMISGEPWSWGHAAQSTAGGALYGAYAGPVALAWAFNNAVAGGAIKGMITQLGW